MDERVLEAVLSAVNEINQQLSVDEQLALSPDAVIFGAEGTLDSLMLVSLIVATEQEIMERLNLTISLSDERTLAKEPSPFRTIGTLAEHIRSLMHGRSDA